MIAKLRSAVKFALPLALSGALLYSSAMIIFVPARMAMAAQTIPIANQTDTDAFQKKVSENIVVPNANRKNYGSITAAYRTGEIEIPDEEAPAPVKEIVNSNVISLLNEDEESITPSAVVIDGNDLYLMDPLALYVAKASLPSLGKVKELTFTKLEPPKVIDGVRYQEFSNFISCPTRKSLIVLDKSGDLFEYFPGPNRWHVYRANLPFFNGQPDPEFIDFSVQGSQLLLLDPERNQIWRTRGRSAKMDGYFLNTTNPWVIRPGLPYVGDGLSMTSDGPIYVVKKHGYITKYDGTTGKPVPFRYNLVANERPSRILTAPGAPLLIVERENNRVLSVDKASGKTNQYLFNGSSDLRGLAPTSNGFWIVNGTNLNFRKYMAPDNLKLAVHRHNCDPRLSGMIMPIAGVRIPGHVGVFPGARRLYRFGIHEGMDLFGGGKSNIRIGTPVRAVESGKVTRADADFKDMNQGEFNRVMSECFREHRTSDKNEDLFRGCQVWINHGNGLVTRYAHLVKINAAIKKEQSITRGSNIGFVGVSGTGQNLPGHAKFPHLHFEIWLDGKYLGWGLTPAETVGVYEDIFGTSS